MACCSGKIILLLRVYYLLEKVAPSLGRFRCSSLVRGGALEGIANS